ncbi:hypothetical protein [Allobaculum sp. Allo2]|uniref:hypothetical protein n=1 Tax=Allobaculum sp. Allo2 TaxID=2853432 RepID=UPI001F61913E|nr:hypothetical protein [Allobaculum sp. Allo2]UNT93462.1 hypothetical protein KWG61_01160 [Allobaculum sp. Allo2]
MKLLEENEEEQLNAAVDHCLEKGLTAVQPADLKSGNWRRRLPLYKKRLKNPDSSSGQHQRSKRNARIHGRV